MRHIRNFFIAFFVSQSIGRFSRNHNCPIGIAKRQRTRHFIRELLLIDFRRTETQQVLPDNVRNDKLADRGGVKKKRGVL